LTDESRLPATSEQDGQESTGARRQPSQATRLVRLAEDRFVLGRTPEADLFAVPKTGARLVRLLRGSGESLRAELGRLYAEQEGSAPSQSALAAGLLVLEGQASHAPIERLELRVAHVDDGVAIDLGDETGRAVIVRPGAWTVEAQAPVLFRRTALTLPLPEPARGGDLTELREALHVTDDSWPLVPAWLVTALFPDVPAPVLFFRGPHGAGKSVAARLLSRLIDPASAQLRSPPRDLGSWGPTAASSRVVALDNVSRLPEWLGDALCRAVTGDGLLSRALYTNHDVAVLTFKRALILTAIAVEGVRGDLADRLLPIELDRLTEDERRTEEELEEAFAVAHPSILGAVCDLLAEVLAILPETRPERLPRLADAGRIFAAVDRVQGTHAFESFLLVGGRLAEEVVEDDSVAQAIRELVETRGRWIGSTRELLDTISPEQRPRGWPETSQALTSRLARAEEALRLVGIKTERRRNGRRRELVLTDLSREKPETLVTTSPTSFSAQPSGKGGDEGGDEGGDVPLVGGDEVPTLVTTTSPPHVTTQTRTAAPIALDGDEGDEGLPSLSSLGIPKREDLAPCVRCGGPGEAWLDGRPLCFACAAEEDQA
jgi:hypothetical protein